MKDDWIWILLIIIAFVAGAATVGLIRMDTEAAGTTGIPAVGWLKFQSPISGRCYEGALGLAADPDGLTMVSFVQCDIAPNGVYSEGVGVPEQD